MKLTRCTPLLAALFALAATLASMAHAAPETSAAPLTQGGLILIDAERLAMAKGRVAAKDAELKPAYDALMKDAARALKAGPWSVMDKTLTPSSGDKHDFVSFGPYWWPNPKTKDGLPYIRRDGEVNPEIRTSKSDDANMNRMVGAVTALAHAYYFTGEEKYAAHAAKLLRAWYLEPATKMNPNLNFGQAIPGVTEGRGIGIIDTVCLLGIPDATTLLEPSTSWTEQDREGLKAWFGDYLDWLLTSKNGKDEAKAANNHGTWYDAQVATFALYVGKPEVARKTLEAAKTKRVASQIKPNGSQPHELARTKSFGYSTMNLNGMLTLGWLGKRVGVDLAGYTSPEGGSIRKALEFMLQYADPKVKWPYKQIHGYKPEALYTVTVKAAVLFEDEGLTKMAEKLCGKGRKEERIRLEMNR